MLSGTGRRLACSTVVVLALAAIAGAAAKAGQTTSDAIPANANTFRLLILLLILAPIGSHCLPAWARCLTR